MKDQPSSGRRPPWADLLLGFGWIGATSFGGGSATLGAIRKTCRKHEWLTDEEFVQTAVLSRITPGVTILSQTILIGRRVGGTKGIFAALVGMLAPAIAVTVLIAAGFQTASRNPALTGTIALVSAVAAGFAVGMTVKFGGDVLRARPRALAGLICLGYIVLGWLTNNPLLVIVLAAAIGALAPALFSHWSGWSDPSERSRGDRSGGVRGVAR